MTAWADIWKEVKKSLDQSSPTMCYAKWQQATIHLQNGMVHCCHHPVPHKISALQVMNTPSALVNTERLQHARQQMLDGVRPPECEYCWNIEDNSDVASDRIQKSAAPWAWKNRERNMFGLHATPTYLEIDLGNTCNMKCMYCSPEISSLWMEEIKRDGEYKLSNSSLHNLDWLQRSGRMPIPFNNPNPYLTAFWKWFPDVYPQLHTLRITGGEPLLNPGLFKIMKMLDEHPNFDLNFTINTNLMCPSDVWTHFLYWLDKITDKVKSVEIYTSVDTYDWQAEYIRHGLEWHTWAGRLNDLLREHRSVFPAIMCTFNVLSMEGFQAFLAWVLSLKVTHKNEHRVYPIYLDFAYLRHPPFLSARILNDHQKYNLDSLYDFITSNMRINDGLVGPGGFEEMEAVKFKGLMDWVKTTPEDIDTLRRDFCLFIREHDRRRGTKFLEVFPTMAEFWGSCAELCD